MTRLLLTAGLCTTLLIVLLPARGLAARPLKVATVRQRVVRALAPLTSTAWLARAHLDVERDPLHGPAVVFRARDERGRVVARVAAERRRGRILDLYVAPVGSHTHGGPDRQRRSARAALRRLVPRRHRRLRRVHERVVGGERWIHYRARADRALIVVGPCGQLRAASLTHTEWSRSQR